MANKYVEFRYEDEFDVVAIDKIVNIGDISQPFDDAETQGEHRILHVFARNISKYNLYNPGLYIMHQDYESKTRGSKGDNFRIMTSEPLNAVGNTAVRKPFASVLFKPSTSGTLDWDNCIYFNSFNGTKKNPIPISVDIGGVIAKNGLPCLTINSEVDFWIRIKNEQLQDSDPNKDVEDGKWGFSLKFTGELHGQ